MSELKRIKEEQHLTQEELSANWEFLLSQMANVI